MALERVSLILHGLWNVPNYIYVFVLGERGRRSGRTDYLLMTTACQPPNADKYCPEQIVSLIASKQKEKEYQFSLETWSKKSYFQSKIIKEGKCKKVLKISKLRCTWSKRSWWQFSNYEALSVSWLQEYRSAGYITSHKCNIQLVEIAAQGGRGVTADIYYVTFLRV